MRILSSFNIFIAAIVIYICSEVWPSLIQDVAGMFWEEKGGKIIENSAALEQRLLLFFLMMYWSWGVVKWIMDMLVRHFIDRNEQEMDPEPPPAART